MRRIITVVFLLLGVVRASAANDVVRVPVQTTLSAGERVAILVSGTLNTNGSHAVRLQFSYDPRAVVVVEARVVDGGAFRGGVAVVDRAFTAPDRGTFVLDCRDVMAITDGPICELIIEGTYGPRSTGTIVPLAVEYDFVPQAGVTSEEGTVTINGQPPVQPLTDGIQGNFPNPFSTSTTFVITLARRDDVTLTVFDASGRVFGEYGPYPLEAGTHNIEFAPEVWKMGSGAWLARMTTSSGVFVHPFTYWK